MRSRPNLPPLESFEPYSPTALPHTRRPSHPATRAGSRSSASTTAAASPPRLSRERHIASWICRWVAAAIMIETLFFKFTGAPESVYIFSQMGMEPWWRYGQGIWELFASILLLTPRLGWAGGLLTLSAIGGAIVSHLTVLGIAIQGDHGLLFGMALVTFACGFVVTVLHRREIPSYTPATPW